MAVDYVELAVFCFTCSRPQVCKIRATTGLGRTETKARLARNDPWEPLLFLSFCSVVYDRRQANGRGGRKSSADATFDSTLLIGNDQKVESIPVCKTTSATGPEGLRGVGSFHPFQTLLQAKQRRDGILEEHLVE